MQTNEFKAGTNSSTFALDFAHQGWDISLITELGLKGLKFSCILRYVTGL